MGQVANLMERLSKRSTWLCKVDPIPFSNPSPVSPCVGEDGQLASKGHYLSAPSTWVVFHTHGRSALPILGSSSAFLLFPRGLIRP